MRSLLTNLYLESAHVSRTSRVVRGLAPKLIGFCGSWILLDDLVDASQSLAVIVVVATTLHAHAKIDYFKCT